MNCKPKKYEIALGILMFVFWRGSLNFGRAVEMNFDGNGYLRHKLGPNENAEKRHPMKLSMWFKTKHPSGLLVAANGQDYGSMFAVALNNGKLRCMILSCDLNSRRDQVEINSVTVSDGRWHLASVVQQGSVLTCQVDGFSKSLTGVERRMTGQLFFGGIPHNRTTIENIWNNSCLPDVENFSGCLGDVFLRNEYIDGILRRQHVTQGKRSVCDHGGSGLMSLQDPKSEFIWQLQNTTSTVTSLDFQIRTLLKNGFIAKISMKQLVLSLFLVKGLIEIKLWRNTALISKSPQALSTSKSDVADGRWHRVICYMVMPSKELTLSIDGVTQFRKQLIRSIITRGNGEGCVGFFRIGGSLHQHHCFVGCVREIFINKALVQPTNQRHIVESKHIIIGSCDGTTDMRGSCDVLQAKVNVTAGVLKGKALPSSAKQNRHHPTKYHSEAAASTAILAMVPHFYAEPNYTMSKARGDNFKSNITDSSDGASNNNSSLPYMIAIALLVAVLVLLLFCVLGVCAGLKRFLCFKDSNKRLNEGDTDSASKKCPSAQATESEIIEMVDQGALPLHMDAGDRPVSLSKNVDEPYEVTEPYYSLNRQQARYWRERDGKLLDSQCRQHIEDSPVNKHPYVVRRSLPPMFQPETIQSPKRRTTTIAAPEVFLAVPDTRKKAFVNKGTLVSKKESRVTTDKTSCKANSKPSHRSSETKKTKGAEELPINKKRRLGYGWAYGSRFALGADSDTDCSDIERMSSHSRYKYRYGKNSDTFHTGRPLRILEASETEEELQSNDERSRDGKNRKWSRFGRKKTFGTFWDQGSRLLNVLSEEEKSHDISKLDRQVKSSGVEVLLTSGQRQHHSSAPLTDLEQDGGAGKRQRCGQNEKGRGVYDAVPGTTSYIKRGDPDGRPEIPHRLNSFLLPSDSHILGHCEHVQGPYHDELNSSEDYLKSSNVIICPFPERHDVARHMNGQEFGTSTAVHLNIEGTGCENCPRHTVHIGGKKKEPKPAAPRLHIRVPKDMLMQRANNLMGSERPTII